MEDYYSIEILQIYKDQSRKTIYTGSVLTENEAMQVCNSILEKYKRRTDLYELTEHGFRIKGTDIAVKPIYRHRLIQKADDIIRYQEGLYTINN